MTDAGGFQLRVEQIDPSHIAPYVALSSKEFESDDPLCDPKHVAWKLLDNPQGPAIGVFVFREERMIGRMAIMPRRFRFGDKTLTAAYVVDFLVDKEFRDMKILLLLARGFRSVAGFDLLLVTPNAAGGSFWKSFGKMKQCFELDTKIVPLRPVALLARAGKFGALRPLSFLDAAWSGLVRTYAALPLQFGGTTVTTEWPSDDALDAMLASGDPGRAMGERNPAFLKWRFRDGPRFKYDVHFVYKKDEPIGYIASRRVVQSGVERRYIVDAFRRWSEGALTTGSHAVSRLGAAEGSELIMTVGNASSGPLAETVTSLFWDAPRRFFSQRIPVFAEWLTQPLFNLSPENLCLTLADCDWV